MFSGNLDLNDLRLLMRVVEYGSYTAASKATGIPKSTLSQRVAALEEAVGTGLLRRNSRSLSLTEAGEILLPHARTIDEVAREAEIALNDRGSIWPVRCASQLRLRCPSLCSRPSSPSSCASTRRCRSVST
ncbi:MAG: LysR family transcriptional regulator [Solirubrobacterales bacterium]|nr:LysR family transcriptional regulator [Solirubrobacterales bacterium]